MANRYKGEVPLVVQMEHGEPHTYLMRFTANSLVELEDAMESGINAIANKLTNSEQLRVRDIRTLVWASLLDRQPNITIEDVGNLITDAGLKPVMEAVSRAFQLAFDPNSEAVQDELPLPLDPEQKSLPLNGSGLRS